MKAAIFGAALGALAFTGCTATHAGVTASATKEADHPAARLYDPSIDASAAVDAALARAAQRKVNVLLVLGANWCHDSRAFAGWMETPRFKALTDARYELVYINVGMPQTKDGHNLHIAERFGVADIEGTPTVRCCRGTGSCSMTRRQKAGATLPAAAKMPFLKSWR